MTRVERMQIATMRRAIAWLALYEPTEMVPCPICGERSWTP